VLIDDDDVAAPNANVNPIAQQFRQAFPFMFEKPSGLTCGDCLWRTAHDGQPYCGARLLLIEDTQPACPAFDLGG
jgi:hypothetical protein